MWNKDLGTRGHRSHGVTRLWDTDAGDVRCDTGTEGEDTEKEHGRAVPRGHADTEEGTNVARTPTSSARPRAPRGFVCRCVTLRDGTAPRDVAQRWDVARRPAAPRFRTASPGFALFRAALRTAARRHCAPPQPPGRGGMGGGGGCAGAPLLQRRTKPPLSSGVSTPIFFHDRIPPPQLPAWGRGGAGMGTTCEPRTRVCTALREAGLVLRLHTCVPNVGTAVRG